MNRRASVAHAGVAPANSRWRGAQAISLCHTLLAVLAGCAAPPGTIFPAVSPPIVWPAPPDTPRIRYLGELRGQASLGVKPTGWDAVRAALGGPAPQVEFSHPAAVAVAGERIFVADTGLGAVHLLNLAARQYKLIRGAPADPLRVPLDLAIVANQLVVVDRGRGALDVFDLEGNWRATRRWPEIAAPVAVAWDRQQRVLWVADAAAHACWGVEESDFATKRQSDEGNANRSRSASEDIRARSASEGREAGVGLTADTAVAPGDRPRRLGQAGTAQGQFNFPTALAWQATIGLVVADAMNFRIQVFDVAAQGAASQAVQNGGQCPPYVVFGRKGDAAGCFARPRGVAVDSEGHIYVVDNQFENIQVFDTAGRLLLAFGEEGGKPGQFSLPAGITIDAQDRIWVADSYNRRVQVFQYLAEKAP